MLRLLRRWHRTVGAVASLFIMMLAVTGILLNHTLDLKLAERHLDWPWLLEHYGVAEVEADRVYLLEDNVISQFDDRVFVDAQPVAKSLKPIIGGIYLDNLTVVASDDALILLSRDGEYIETMGAAEGVPSQIQNIGVFRGLPVLQTRQGMWRGDILLEQWQRLSLDGVSWSEPTSMPRVVKQDLARYFYGQGVSIQRFVLDLHTGYFIGQLGVWLLDFIAVLMIALSLSGLWLWLRTKR